jgi:phosphoglycolate phosphatase-like HAD superfamily hydrolase
VEAGKGAGIKTCAVTYGYSPIEKLLQSKPDFIKDSFKDVIKLIKGEED